MAKKIIILIVIACFSAVLLAAQTPSLAPRKLPPRKPVMTAEGFSKAMEEAAEQRRRSNEERRKHMGREAWKRLLRVNEQQWTVIKPKVDKIQALLWSEWADALCGIRLRERRFHWYKYSEGTGGFRAKAPHEMTEGHRIADELVDLLDDENSTDEQIRKKIDALQQVRENARKELAQARRELAALLTTARQEAIFLIMTHID